MKAVSPLVGFVLTIFITIMITTLTFTVIKPTLERNRGFNVINEASVNLELLSSAINEVATEAEGSKRTITLSVSDGEYLIDKNSNNIIFTFEPSVDLGVIGRIGDKFLEKGLVFFDFFNNYLDNSFPKNLINISGNWRVYNNRLEGINGTAYYFIDKNLNGFYVSSNFGSDNNLGQIFVSPVNLSNLVLYLTFDEGSGNIVYDYSGNKNNGTYYGYNPHTQSNSALLYLTGSSPINLTHYFYLPSKAILSDVNLTVSYKNNTISGENVNVYVNGNYIGSFNSAGGTSYTFINILKSNFTAGALNSITYEGNATNITQSTLKYLQDIGWVDGKFGKALSFDGVDDYADIPNNPNGNYSRAFVAWVKNVPNSGRYEVIDSRGTFFNIQNGKACIYISGASSSYLCSSNLLNSNQWNFIAGVYEYEINTVKVYVNGLFSGSLALPKYPDTGLRNDVIGWCSYCCPLCAMFNGTIDEVMIFNRSLTDDEIKFLYQEGLKKLQNSGMAQFSSQIKPYIAISNPSGKIYVENLRVGNQNSREIKLIKPFYGLEFDSSFRFSKGNHQIKIENIGFNSTSKRPIIRISEG